MQAHITPTLSASTRSSCPLDNDADIAALQQQLTASATHQAPTQTNANTPPAPPLRTPTEAAPADDGDSDSDDGEQPVVAGPPISRADLAPRMAVAVPFLSKRHGETHFEGRVVRVMTSTARVRFPDVDGTSTCFDVGLNRLFAVAHPPPATEAAAPTAAPRQPPATPTQGGAADCTARLALGGL